MLKFWAPKSDETTALEKLTFLESSSTHKARRFEGWRFGVLVCTSSTGFVLVVNMCLALWAAGKLGWARDGQPILYEGNCSKASKLSTALHILINGMSTALLCASSYCMQCLSAPTRQELDLAHKRQTWLDIGVLSPRNIKSVSKSRRVRWLILGLSTIPLHLMFNSVVFFSAGSNLYYPLLVKESILSPNSTIEPYTRLTTSLDYTYGSGNPDYNDNFDDDAYPWLSEATRLRDLHTNGGLERLEPLGCLKAYGTQFQTRGSLFLVTTDETYENRSLISYLGGPWVVQKWLCSTPNCDNVSDVGKALRFNNTEVAYCLSEVLPEKCRLQLSLPLTVIVLFFNAMKLVCMITMLFGVWENMNDPPIMNIGDTVTSFLARSDVSTRNMGLASLDDLRRAMNMSHRWDTRPKEFKGKRRLRFTAASRTRWALTCALYSSILGLAAWLLKYSVEDTALSENISPIALMTSYGWGKADMRSMIYSATKDLITNAMFVNSPQLVLSWVYFSYNGLLTLLAVAREWESYALHRKGLRISNKQEGQQRSTYFLQLPYRIAIPFMIISAFLHWLVSQSFFLVSVQVYKHDATEGWIPALNNAASRFSIGYSPLPMLVGVATGGLLLVGVLAAGFVPFKTAMPVVSSCSAAISAACQPLEEDDSDAAIAAVKWGVIGRFKNGFEHCGFSRENVGEPVVGRSYR